MIKLFLTLALVMFPLQAMSKTLFFNEGVLLQISSSITYDTLDLIQYMDKADQDNPINIIISSPGGYIAMGTIFITAMERAKARGITINCVVPTVAASMAFHIFAHCTNRYIFPNAYLLFHEGRVSIRGSLTAKQLKEESIRLRLMTKLLERDLIRKLGISKRRFDKLNEAEYLIPGIIFKKAFPKFNLKIVHDVILPEGFNLFELK